MCSFPESDSQSRVFNLLSKMIKIVLLVVFTLQYATPRPQRNQDHQVPSITFDINCRDCDTAFSDAFHERVDLPGNTHIIEEGRDFSIIEGRAGTFEGKTKGRDNILGAGVEFNAMSGQRSEGWGLNSAGKQIGWNAGGRTRAQVNTAGVSVGASTGVNVNTKVGGAEVNTKFV